MFISLFVAYRISAIKEERTELFPYGQFVYEALYSMLKGVMITGVLLVTFVQNTSAVLRFLGGGDAIVVNTQVIFIYSIAMVILCFGSAVYYRLQNKKTQNSSTILRAEYSAAVVDGFMSAGIGVALVSIRFISLEGPFGFLHYIGDSLLVLLGKGPLVLIRDSFIELAGGTLQNRKDRLQIEGILHKYLQPDELLTGNYISKTGSSYLVVAYLNTEFVASLSSSRVQELRKKISMELTELYPNILLEVVLASSFLLSRCFLFFLYFCLSMVTVRVYVPITFCFPCFKFR